MSEALRRQFEAETMPRAGSPAPGISSERLAALEAGAGRLISGTYVTSGNTLSVTAVSEDPVTQQITGPVHATGDLAAVVQALGRQFHAPVSKAALLQTNLITSTALREYSLALDTAGPAALAHYEQAIAANPNFGPAYLDLVRAASSQGDAARAQSTITLAQTHIAAFAPRDRAYLRLENATFQRDGKARVEALKSIAALNEQNPDLPRTLADAEMAIREPAQAAAYYRQAIAQPGSDPNLQNLLAYAALYAGDEAGARAAAAEYRRLRPEDPNVYDTQGDVELAFGHLAQAEKVYQASPDQRFQNCLPTWKAARAHLYSGDVAGASALFEKHRVALEKTSSALAAFRAAQWLALTGHRDQAADAMRKLAASMAQPEFRSAGYAQAAIWAAISLDRTHAANWAAAALQPPVQATVLFAGLARFLADPPAPAEVWKTRAEHQINGGNAPEVRRLALGFALLLSHDFTAALPLWKQIYEAGPATDTLSNFLYGWALLETGNKTEAARLLRLNPLPDANVAPSFEALYIPALLEWRKSSLRQ